MKINPAYSGMTFDLDGMEFVIHLDRDDDLGPPWLEYDGYGEVSEWTRQKKAPGEMILCEDRSWRRYYDFAGAVRKAREERWGCREGNKGMTKGQQAHNAALADFEYLRTWCANLWEYVSLTVTLLDEDGDEIEELSESLGGVENIDRDFVMGMAHDLAREIIAQQESIMDSIEPDEEMDVDDQIAADGRQAA